MISVIRLEGRKQREMYRKANDKDGWSREPMTESTARKDIGRQES